MTALMSQVTCGFCMDKVDESKWKEHLTSSKHLQTCKAIDTSIAKSFFKMIFEARPEKKKIFNLKNEKSHEFWRLYFLTKLPKEKFDKLCNGSIVNSEIEKNLESDFNDFILNVVPIIGKIYFPTMKDKTFWEICSIEVNIALLYKHINSKEHKDIEYYLIKSCMTYCKVCKKEIRNDEWREHEISENHLEIEKQMCCKVCKVKYNFSDCGDQYTSIECKRRLATENHNRTQDHKQNQEFFDSYFT